MEYNEAYIKKLLPKRPEDANKGTFGHVLNIAGSGFYKGAAYFSSIAPLKVGCGLSTLASVKSVCSTVSAFTPDVILLSLFETKRETISHKAVKIIEEKFGVYDVISLGCGLSQNKETVKFFEKLMKILAKSDKPVVIDADGLNILSTLDKVNLPKNTILTPHPKELSRLMGANGVNVEEILAEPEEWAKKCSEKYNCITVLKLHKTLVADYRVSLYENFTGNSALSHGGSGDILCGMISGFIAQGASLFDACCIAVYLHGLSAEIASNDLTEYSVLASDLLKYIPQAIKTLL